MATTTTEENKALAREHFERVWSDGEFDTNVLADDFSVQLHLGEYDELTLEEFQGLVTQAHEAFPDLHKEPDDVIATDEKVVIRYTFTGTQEGEFKGIPPTGNEVEIAAVAIYRVEDSKLAESVYVADFLRMMKQLGVVD